MDSAFTFLAFFDDTKKPTIAPTAAPTIAPTMDAKGENIRPTASPIKAPNHVKTISFNVNKALPLFSNIRACLGVVGRGKCAALWLPHFIDKKLAARGKALYGF
jgi:hypothetical protein